MVWARDPIYLRSTLAPAKALTGSAMVCPHFPAYCLLQIVKRCRELRVAAGPNDQRSDRMLRRFGASLQRGGRRFGRPRGKRAGVFEGPVEIALVGDEGVCNLLIFR